MFGTDRIGTLLICLGILRLSCIIIFIQGWAIEKSIMFLTAFGFIDTLVLLSIAVVLFIKYTSRNFDYWKKKNVFYVDPLPIFGNFYEISMFKLTIGEFLRKMYNMTKEPFLGIFTFSSPLLILRSPELIKQVLVKDFKYFCDRTAFTGDYEPVSKYMPFFTKNPEWKVIRSKMTRVFTSGKLKQIMPAINNIGVQMVDYINKTALSQNGVEAKEICEKYSTDVIAELTFGINAKSFENEDADFRRIGRMIFEFRLSVAIQQTSLFFFHTLAKLFRMKFMNREVSEFLNVVFWKAIEAREKSGEKGNDLVDNIVDLRKKKDFCNDVDFEGEKVVAQAAQFFVAGFETTSSTMAFTLYELCLQPDIQNRVRDEIKETLQKDGKFTYKNVGNMKYLHMCISETLRKYPTLPFLDRKCNTNYKIPGTDVIIEKGTPVYIPMFGLHYDPQYWHDPEKYDPERFSDENIDKIQPFCYLPFGEGPRVCLGERFGMLGTKLGLLHILSNFIVERTKETPVPLEFETKTFILASKVGLPMKFIAKAV